MKEANDSLYITPIELKPMRYHFKGQSCRVLPPKTDNISIHIGAHLRSIEILTSSTRIRRSRHTYQSHIVWELRLKVVYIQHSYTSRQRDTFFKGQSREAFTAKTYTTLQTQWRRLEIDRNIGIIYGSSKFAP